MVPPGPACADAKVSAGNAEGKQFTERRQLSSAADSYRKADKAAKGRCSATLEALYDLGLRMEDPEIAVSAAVKLLSLAETDASRSKVELMEARALLTPKAGEEAKHARSVLEQANALTKAAFQHDHTDTQAAMLQGRVLAKLDRTGEAREVFSMVQRAAGADTAEGRRARRFEENPALAKHTEAPSFSAKTLDGATITREELNGKTVLIDFWATWCPACREETDYISMLAGRYKDRQLVVISVSVDSSETLWKKYVQENRMKWPQVLDADRQMRDEFRVGVFPTYILIDENGSERERIVGSRQDLKEKLLNILPKSEAASGAPAPLPATSSSKLANNPEGD